MESQISEYSQNDFEAKLDRFTIQAYRYKRIKYHEFRYWEKCYFCIIFLDISKTSNNKFTVLNHYSCQNEHKGYVQIQSDWREVLEYANRPKNAQLWVNAKKNSLSKKKFSQLCRAISRYNKSCTLFNFKFNSQTQLSKLFHSVWSCKL